MVECARASVVAKSWFFILKQFKLEPIDFTGLQVVRIYCVGEEAGTREVPSLQFQDDIDVKTVLTVIDDLYRNVHCKYEVQIFLKHLRACLHLRAMHRYRSRAFFLTF